METLTFLSKLNKEKVTSGLVFNMPETLKGFLYSLEINKSNYGLLF